MLSKHRLSTRGGDGAYANDKFLNWESSKIFRQVVPCTISCINHNNALVEVSQVACAGHDIQSDLFRLVSLLRMTGSFPRLVSAVAGVVDKLLELHLDKEPPADAHNFTLVLQEYMLANRRVFKQAAAAHIELARGTARQDKSTALYLKAWQDFIFWFNGCNNCITWNPFHKHVW